DAEEKIEEEMSEEQAEEFRALSTTVVTLKESIDAYAQQPLPEPINVQPLLAQYEKLSEASKGLIKHVEKIEEKLDKINTDDFVKKGANIEITVNDKKSIVTLG